MWLFSLQFLYCCNSDRLGKFACPRVNDDQKIDVDDQKLNSGGPHDYWIFLELSLYDTVDFSNFSTA